MALRVAQFNILGRKMAGSMWFHYARDFLPPSITKACPDWYQSAGYPRCLLWHPRDGPSRFYRLPVLLAEIRALKADILCLVELDCFEEIQSALGTEGYDAIFQRRPGKADGCGIFWRREALAASGHCRLLTYSVPANDRIAVAQALEHLATGQRFLVVSTHLHWDQQAGHQVAEAEELLAFAEEAASAAGADGRATIVCGDLNTTPGAAAYEVMCRHFQDAALQDDAAVYAPGSFTSLKPDVYYFARPRGSQYDSRAQDEWHLQEGRQEVIDYIFYDPGAFELVAPIELPCLGGEPSAKRARTSKPPYGYWAGDWAFSATPAPGWEAGLRDPNWWPVRTQGLLQFGIPNRLHGSDHLPVACTLRLCEASRG